MELAIQYYEFKVVHKEFYDSFELWRKSVKDKPQSGIYTLKSSNKVPRVLAEDIEGVLYIGKGDILSPNHRLGNLINALNNTAGRHEAGIRYNQSEKWNTQAIEHYNEYGFRNKYPLDSLLLIIELVENARELESKRLSEYQDKFGELPPLNRQQ